MADRVSRAVTKVIHDEETRIIRSVTTIWTIVVDAGIDCPSCDQEMETVFRFKPAHGKVAGLSRQRLQNATFDTWLDNSFETKDVCPGCGYEQLG